MVDCVLHALADQAGSVLVFLPGQAEIRRVHQSLQEVLGARPEILLCPLHGELDLNAQRAAIDPPAKGLRKVVLATNIAETSLTIDGVRVVIDAGLARVPRFDPGSGMTRLDTQRISRASATQRAGRAGRLEPGVCYRLWSEAQHDQLAAHGSAEILQADLAGLALQLARWGVTPSSCAGSTSRQLQRTPRHRTCWRDSAPSGRAAATPSANMARPWPNCRLTHASRTCCCGVRIWAWHRWPAMWLHCWGAGHPAWRWCRLAQPACAGQR